MRKKFFAIAATALAIAGAVTGGVALAGGSAPDSATRLEMVLMPEGVQAAGEPQVIDRELTPLSNDMKAAAGEPPTCWTQFAPTWPLGGKMAQYYRNCNGHPITVFSGYTKNGVTVNFSGCTERPLVDGESIIWGYSRTEPDANWGTFAC